MNDCVAYYYGREYVLGAEAQRPLVLHRPEVQQSEGEPLTLDSPAVEESEGTSPCRSADAAQRVR